jgi:uncharacterized membrane protein
MIKQNYLLAFLMVFVTTAVVVGSQSLWKYRLNQLEAGNYTVPAKAVAMLYSPYFWGGLLGYIFATVAWIYILSLYNISLVLPMNSVGYVIATVIGYVAFKEEIRLNHFLGIFVIFVGIFILTRK